MATRELVDSLIAKGSEMDHCLSIYMNTHRTNQEAEQDPLRLKNLLKEARTALSDRGLSKQKIDSWFEEVEQMMDRSKFWLHQKEGLALFFGEDFFEYHKLPYTPEERVYADNHFYIKPLVSLLSRDGEFLLLSLSQNNVATYRVNPNQIEEVVIEDMPTSLDEYQKFDVEEKNLSAGSGGTTGSAVFHGKGDAGSDDVRYVEEFLKRVENRVTSYAQKDQLPVMLAGVDSVTALYKKVNKYDKLWDVTLSGNPEHKSESVLHEESWAVAEDQFSSQIHSELESDRDLISTDRFTYELNEVIRGAYYGQIDKLFVTGNEFKLGYFEEDKNELHITGTHDENSYDLYNMAIIKTLSNSGDVVMLEPDEMPKKSDISAVLRYPVQAEAG